MTVFDDAPVLGNDGMEDLNLQMKKVDEIMTSQLDVKSNEK